MAAVPPRYWFRAHTYGWGWGLPCAWQGWVVLGVWFAIFIDGLRLLHRPGPAHLVFVLLMSAVLIGICYLKGEPPKWRWGGSDA